MCSNFTRLFFFKFLRLIPVLRCWVVCCEHRVDLLLVVGVGGGQATHVVCCAESQITGSLPLLSDLDIVCEMEHEGRPVSVIKTRFTPRECAKMFFCALLWKNFHNSLPRQRFWEKVVFSKHAKYLSNDVYWMKKKLTKNFWVFWFWERKGVSRRKEWNRRGERWFRPAARVCWAIVKGKNGSSLPFQPAEQKYSPTHKERPAKYLGCAILSISFENVLRSADFVIKSSSENTLMFIMQKGQSTSTGTKKKGSSYQQQTETYCSRQLLFKYIEKWTWIFSSCQLATTTFIHLQTLWQSGGPYVPNSAPSPCKIVAWTSLWRSLHMLPIHRENDSRPSWKQLQRRTTGKPCTNVEATPDTSNVF